MGGPEKTSFFQALQIPTKITKGTIEIINDVPIITTGDKVGASEATLLGLLKIFPFSYGLIIQKVYDQGSVFDPAILAITAVTEITFKEAEMLKEFLADPSKFAAAAAPAAAAAAPAAAAAKA